MSLFDIPAPAAPTVVDGARRVRQILSQVVNQTEHGLARIREIATKYGKANIGTELGADAADLQTLYDALKVVLESGPVGKSVDDL